MAKITFTFPDDDDPIFSGAFTVGFPIRLEKSPEESTSLLPTDLDDPTFAQPKRPGRD